MNRKKKFEGEIYHPSSFFESELYTTLLLLDELIEGSEKSEWRTLRKIESRIFEINMKLNPNPLEKVSKVVGVVTKYPDILNVLRHKLIVTKELYSHRREYYMLGGILTISLGESYTQLVDTLIFSPYTFRTPNCRNSCLIWQNNTQRKKSYHRNIWEGSKTQDLMKLDFGRGKVI